MMKKGLTILVGLAASLAFSHAVSSPTASELLNRASVRAQAEGKGIFVIFHATWCIWCFDLEEALTQKAVLAVLRKRFVIVTIDVGERQENLGAATPGGEEMLNLCHGKNQGIPYLVALTANQRYAGDSRVESEDSPGKLSNFGFPSEPNEFFQLKTMLQRANPRLTEDEWMTIQDALIWKKVELGIDG